MNVFPLRSSQISVYKGYAAPRTWGNWIIIHEQSFGGREIEVSFDTSSSTPEPFSIELDIDTSFSKKPLWDLLHINS